MLGFIEIIVYTAAHWLVCAVLLLAVLLAGWFALCCFFC